MLSWSFLKCDRCEHPAEQYSLLQWQVTEMLKRASNRAVTGGDDLWKHGAFKALVQSREKCKDLSAHIYPVTPAVWGHPPLASLTVPSWRDKNTFQRQKMSLEDQNRHFSSSNNSQSALWGSETISADRITQICGDIISSVSETWH